MRELFIPTSLLIPTQTSLNTYWLDKLLNDYRAPLDKPVPVVEYENRYLLGDGHHRASRSHILNQEARARLLETDEDVLRCVTGHFVFCNTLEEFFIDYISRYRPLCEEAGVQTVDDLVRSHYKERDRHDEHI